MGVDIGPLFKGEEITFKDLKNKVIAIDAYNVIHQFLSSIRGKDGSPLKNAKGEITSHLSGILYRTANLVEANIKPVYVFDGKPHPLKLKTLEERQKRKEIAQKEYIEALEEGDLERARIKAQQTSRVTEDIVKQSKELLNALGIPYVQAPSEGEAQASYMVKKGDAFAVGSQDYDCLLVGAPVLIRNLTSSEKRKLPGKKAYVRIFPEQIRLDTNLKILGLNQKQLIDIGILVGTDFNEGIKGIGPKKSLILIKEKGSIENVISSLRIENPPSIDEINEIRRIFLEPEVTDDYFLEWSPLNKEKVIKILCDENQFSIERVESALEKFSFIDNIKKQRTLF